jgi:hypothetical protein
MKTIENDLPFVLEKTMNSRTNSFAKTAMAAAMASALYFFGAPPSMAADHGDGPFSSVKRSADIGDVYAFLDPNDNAQLVVALTVQGFIVPSEAVNFSVFDDQVTFRFDFETTGDARPDQRITVNFSKKVTSGSTPQTATIILPNRKRFAAPTTASTLSSNASPPPTVTADPGGSGIQFFAGEVDDPFFFDIPGFNRFVASVLGAAANPADLQRGRDSFAGYNTLAIALRIPVSLFNAPSGNMIGVSAVTLGGNKQIDRMGNPAINVALVPFPQKDAYNLSNTVRDSSSKNPFAADIVGTLKALGTSDANIGVLAGIAVSNGDMLRVKLDTPNTGTGGGNNAEAAYPNGRRLGDDVIDTIIGAVTNGAITDGDHAGPNEKPFRDEFPFFAETHQPLPTGEIDDLTRN